MEPTSTVVLTSKDAHFVDVRVLLEPYSQEKVSPIIPDTCIQWAFAGKSRSTKEVKNEQGTTVSWHSAWDHWIDSKSEEPVFDEGDMNLQEDETVLETGNTVDPDTDHVEYYEELWKDLPIDEIGKKGNKSSIVAKAEMPEENFKGLVVKVGGWCQGIAKRGDQLTVERWRRQPQEGGEGELPATEHTETTRNGWVRIFKTGDADRILPCRTMCEQTNGRFVSLLRSDLYTPLSKAFRQIGMTFQLPEKPRSMHFVNSWLSKLLHLVPEKLTIITAQGSASLLQVR